MTLPGDKYQTATIVSRKDYAPDLWSILVRLEKPLSFKPGQYATICCEGKSRPIERAYSIVSSPLESEMEFFFELVPAGELTPLLYRLQPGETFLMRRQAKGLFTLDAQSGHKSHYLAATVTGVAPYVSMVRTLARQSEQGQPPDLRLIILHAASRSWELAYRDELEAFAAKYSWLCYVPTISRPWEDPEWKGETGRVEDILRKYLDTHRLGTSDTTVYFCGHPTMIENSIGIVKRKGFTKESIRQEIYWIPKKTEQ